MTEATALTSRRPRRLLGAVAAALLAVALIVDPLARHTLAGGRSIDLGVLELRLTYNTGVAFSMGDQLPTLLLLAATGLITAGVGVFAWRSAPTSTWPTVVGLGAIVAGAAANVIDRTIDGKVTDYFHTGWFATFNLADTFLTLGVIAVVVGLLRETRIESPQESTP